MLNFPLVVHGVTYTLMVYADGQPVCALADWPEVVRTRIAALRRLAAGASPTATYGVGDYVEWRAALSRALVAAADEIDRLRAARRQAEQMEMWR